MLRIVHAGCAAMLALFVMAGCGGGGAPVAAPKPPDTKAEPKEHAHAAPHGGTLVEIGEHFAVVELKLDPAEGKLTAWVHDGCAENPVRIAQEKIELVVRKPGAKKGEELTLALKAVENKLTGEKVGDTSQFEAVSDQLKNATQWDGELGKLEIKGKTFDDTDFNFPKGKDEHDHGHDHKKESAK